MLHRNEPSLSDCCAFSVMRYWDSTRGRTGTSDLTTRWASLSPPQESRIGQCYIGTNPASAIVVLFRLCDTGTRHEEEPGPAQNGVTDTRTGPDDSEVVTGSAKVLQ